MKIPCSLIVNPLKFFFWMRLCFAIVLYRNSLWSHNSKICKPYTALILWSCVVSQSCQMTGIKKPRHSSRYCHCKTDATKDVFIPRLEDILIATKYFQLDMKSVDSERS